MSERLVLPFFTYEAGARSREEVRRVHQRNREKIVVHRAKFASLKKRLAEATIHATKRSRDMIHMSVVSNRRRSQQIYALAVIEHSIAQERVRDILLRSEGRIERQLMWVKEESRRKARKALSEEGIRGRVDKLRKHINQKRVRLAGDISATQRGSVQAAKGSFQNAQSMMLRGKKNLLLSHSELRGTIKDRHKIIEDTAGRGFERARVVMLSGKENFSNATLGVKEAIRDRQKVMEDSRNMIRSGRASFEDRVRGARKRLHMRGGKAKRLMAERLLSGAEDFRREKNAAAKEFDDRRGEIAQNRASLEESVSAAGQRFKLKGEELEQRRKAPTPELGEIATSRKDQLEARSRELKKKFRGSIEAARDSFMAGVAEKKEMMMRRSKDFMEQGHVRRDQMKKNIANRRVLILLDVKFAQHSLGEVSKRLQAAGNRTVEQLAARREAVVRRARAERKARLIRNALALIRSMP